MKNILDFKANKDTLENADIQKGKKKKFTSYIIHW